MTDAYDIPLDKIDVTQAALYQSDTIGGYFKRLRDEAACSLLFAKSVWPLLVYYPLCGHYVSGHQ